MKKILYKIVQMAKYVVWGMCLQTAFYTLLFASEGMSQAVSLKDINVSVDFKGTPLIEVFDDLSFKSSLNFYYKKELVENWSITYSNRNISMEKVLLDISQTTGLGFKRINETIHVVEIHKNEKQRVVEQLVSGQTRRISGKVTSNEDGEGLPGVNVVEKGTSNGTVTSLNGEYSLEVSEGAVLMFSSVGYIREEVPVSNRSVIDLVMISDVRQLQELVVVGYGEQKKENLTGSVASVNLLDQESRAVTQSSQILAGKVSGVTVTQPSGQPGKNKSNIVIRGLGTFSSAGTQPLILVDGLATSIDNVNPNDIESISVLKDAASASIYGTRAANGVILIKTKRGKKDGFNLSYNSYAGWKKHNTLPENVSAWEHATLINEARENVGQGRAYTDDEINKYKTGSDPDNYPNINHLENLLSSGSGFQTSHNMSFMNSADNNSYLFSIGYLDENGLVAKTNYKRYNFLFNFDSDLMKNMKLSVNMSGNRSATTEPLRALALGVNAGQLIGYAQQVPAIIPAKKTDGTYGHWHDYGIQRILDSENMSESKNGYFLGSVNLDWNLFKDFTLSGKFGYNYENYNRNSYQSVLKYDDVYTYGPNQLSVASSDNSLMTTQLLARYDLTLNKHIFNFLGGFSQEEFRYDYMDAYRDRFPNDLLYELNGGSAANMKNSGTAAEWALRSFFGRANYIFNEKYLFEANVRYDGTSRFPTENRWALFPSFSAGWRLSEESFIKNNLNWVDNLKVRGSWGILGNQNIGNYPYQNTITLARNYTFGGNLYSGAYIDAVANRDIRWEKTTMTDIGLDITLFKNKLDFVIDYFHKYTSGILYNISVSKVLGMGSAEVNAGEVKNTGIEFLVGYYPSIGKLQLRIAPNFSVIHNEVMKIAGGERDISRGLFVGKPLGSIYGYVADGLFVDQEDVNNYPAQPYQVKPGYIRYKDISGKDGILDDKVNPDYDRKVIGTKFPKVNYGFNLGATFNNFDFSLQLQGVSGNKNYLGGAYQQTAFVNGGTAQRWQMENRWTQENPDRNAKYPLMLEGSNNGMRFISTYWLRDAGFLQVKNIQLGYNLPGNLLRSLGIQNTRVFINGENIHRFDNYYKGWDPEMLSMEGANGEFYPNTATYSVGIKVDF
jgi:TonB-dependent starch-binding outer membrane protein SusC